MNDRQSILNQARDVIRNDAAAVSSVESQLGESFIESIALLSQCKGKVLVTGMGTSGATARRMAHLLSCGGTPSMFIHPADGLHGGLGAVSSQDVLIALSKGGKSDEINEFVSRAKSRGVSAIIITANEDSPLGKLADVCLVINTPPGSEPGEMFPMGSTLAVSAVGDALALILMGLKGYPWEDFLFTHPGGAVGKNNTDQRQDL